MRGWLVGCRRRRLQLRKHLSDPAHPFHKFSTGNLETLGKTPQSKGQDVRGMVEEFYQSKYSANLMKLVVYGRQSLDELQSMVKQKFAPVVDKDLRPNQFDGVRDWFPLWVYTLFPPAIRLYALSRAGVLSRACGWFNADVRWGLGFRFA
eukprot:4776-Pyramimonas_sp.AAC.1